MKKIIVLLLFTFALVERSDAQPPATGANLKWIIEQTIDVFVPYRDIAGIEEFIQEGWALWNEVDKAKGVDKALVKKVGAYVAKAAQKIVKLIPPIRWVATIATRLIEISEIFFNVFGSFF